MGLGTQTFEQPCKNIYVYIFRRDAVHRQAAVFLQSAGRQIGVLVFDLAIEG